MSLKTISQVAEELDIAQHVLRFWEKEFPIIKPLKRNGRRLYNEQDIANLTKIKELLYNKGYTIKGVKKMLQTKQNDIAYKECIENSLAELEEIYKIISDKYGM